MEKFLIDSTTYYSIGNHSNLDNKTSWLDTERRKFSDPKNFTQYVAPLPYYKPQVQRRAVTPEMMHFIKDSFEKFDSRRKGYLNRQDLKLAMLSLLGIKPTQVFL